MSPVSGLRRLFLLLLAAYWSALPICQASPGEDDDSLMPFLHRRASSKGVSALSRSFSRWQSIGTRTLAKDVPDVAVPVSRQVEQLNEDANQDLLYKLYDEVLHNGYRKDVRPMPKCSQTTCPRRTEVKLGMRVLQILGLNADDSTLSTQVMLSLMWPDPRLSFDGAKYFQQGTWDSLKHSVPVKVPDIWLPDVVLANTADPHTTMFTDPNAVLYDRAKLDHDGYNVRLLQPAIVRVKCPVDLKDFPMDQQTCQIIFRSRANAGWLKLSLVTSDEHLDKSVLHGLVNTKDEYDVLSVDSKDGTYYCPDTGLAYPEIVYTIVLSRRMEYYALNVVLPLQILSLLSVGTLYIAPGTNRIFYGVTLVLTLMSVTFFMGAFLPRTGGGNTWLEYYEQNVYMAVITPLFFGLFTEVYCRIRRLSPDFSDDDEKELVENVEYVDSFARVAMGLVIALWVLKVALDKFMMRMRGEEINLLPFKVYNWVLAVVIMVVVVTDIRALVSRRKQP